MKINYLVIFVFISFNLSSAEKFSKKRTLLSREKRQIGHPIQNAVRKIRRKINGVSKSIDRIIIPKVEYAAEKLRDDVGPSIANTILDVTNKVIVKTAHGIKNSAKFIREKVAPAIEDRVIAVSNAAVPMVNDGIDVVGAGIKVGVNKVSEKTSSGIENIGKTVLGEQRHNRIQKIADNLSINFNNSVISLAESIKQMSPDDHTNNTPKEHINRVSQHQPHFHESQFFQPQNNPPYDHYQSKYHLYYNGHTNTTYDSDDTTKDLSVSKAIGKVLSNGAYSISTKLFGSNLTEAVAPIARSMSNAIQKRLPSTAAQTIPSQSLVPKKLRSCTRPDGGRGYCQDLSDCPDLVMKLSVLRRSVCFKKLFSPGVCCPDNGQLQKFKEAQRRQEEEVRKLQETLRLQAQKLQTQLPAAPGTTGQFPSLLNNAALLQAQQNILKQQQLLNQLKAQQALQAQAQLAVKPPTLQVHPQVIKPVAPTFSTGRISRENVVINRNPRNDRFRCGVPVVPTARVVGGDESKVGEWPWTAAIYLHGPKEREFWCGGSLVSEDFVLTAAHCTKDSKEKEYSPSQFTVHLGDYNIRQTHEDHISKPQIFSVRYIIAHQDFRRQGYFNDIALMKLSREVEFTEYILPLCLPPPALERSHLDSLVGQKASVIGYGATKYDGPQSNVLHDVELPIWKNSDCDRAYFQPISDIFICAGYSHGGRDACQGDSGGPMQMYYGGRWIQLGIVSFGNRCAEPGYPGVYTRITRFLPWIRKHLA